MKSIIIMIVGFVIIIIGYILKSYSLTLDIITTILFTFRFIMFALGGFLTSLNAVCECLKQNNDED